jgi:hypothetical protein
MTIEPSKPTIQEPAMEQPIEYFVAQARRISETSPTTQIHGVLFNTAIGAVASGTVYGHKTVPDGHQIRTSLIVAACSVNGFRIIETKSGSTYLLAHVGQSRHFRDQWGMLQAHLNTSEEVLASLPRSDFSTFGPEHFHVSHMSCNTEAFADFR